MKISVRGCLIAQMKRPDAKEGQGNQCQTPGVKFKEYTRINRENGINLEETGERKKNGKKKTPRY